MLIKKNDEGGNEKINKDRMNNLNDYEIQKYMQPNVKPVNLPDLPSFMRAQNEDPGQSSPRS